jgi:hypothetical protein
MREWTQQCRWEEAFRQELFRLINQYVNSPKDATLGRIVRTLVNFQQIKATVEERCQRTCLAILSEKSARTGERQLCFHRIFSVVQNHDLHGTIGTIAQLPCGRPEVVGSRSKAALRLAASRQSREPESRSQPIGRASFPGCGRRGVEHSCGMFHRPCSGRDRAV